MRNTVIFSVLFFLFIQMGAGEQQIIGGNTAGAKQFKHMALLKKNGNFICGGSLITRRHVLTVKHCVASGSLGQFQVVLGEYRRLNGDGTEQVKGVIKICKHPTVDAAVLFLSSYVTLNSAVQTIKLATSLPWFGAQTTVSGWGWTIHGVSSSSNKLKYITLPRASTSACNGEGLNVQSHELCIGKSTGSYMNVCHGDGGSPLVYPASPNSNLSQIGIVERGHGSCPNMYHYAVFVSVPSIYNWILDSCSVGYYLPGTWTQWIDRDDPTGKGDWETRSSIIPKPCGSKTPVYYQTAVVSTSYCKSPLSECARSSNQVLTKSPSYGLRCMNSNQKIIKKTSGWWFRKKTRFYKCRCCDYKIRFKCPLYQI